MAKIATSWCNSIGQVPIHRRYMRSWCLPFCPPSHVDILMVWYEQTALYDSDLITPVYPRRKQTGLSFQIDMLLASISPYPQPLDGLHAFSPSIPIKISPSMKQIVPALGFAILDSIWSPSACQSWTNVSQNWRETLKEALVFGGKTCFLWLKVHGWLSQFSTKKTIHPVKLRIIRPADGFMEFFFAKQGAPSGDFGVFTPGRVQRVGFLFQLHGLSISSPGHPQSQREGWSQRWGVQSVQLSFPIKGLLWSIVGWLCR